MSSANETCSFGNPALGDRVPTVPWLYPLAAVPAGYHQWTCAPNNRTLDCCLQSGGAAFHSVCGWDTCLLAVNSTEKMNECVGSGKGYQCMHWDGASTKAGGGGRGKTVGVADVITAALAVLAVV